MAKKENKKVDLGFALLAIHPVHFFQKEESYFFEPGKLVYYSTQFSFTWLKENSVVRVLMKVNASFDAEVTEENSVAGMDVVFDYILNNPPDDIEGEHGKLKLPEAFRFTFLSIAISTGRGIFFERTRGTSLQYSLLPLIDPRSIMDEV